MIIAYFTNLFKHLRNRYLFVIDVVLLPVAVCISYWLRLENFDLKLFAPGWLLFAALSVVVVPVVFYLFGIYRRYWLYASVEEVLILIAAVAVSSMVVGVVSLAIEWALYQNTSMVPRSIPVLFCAVALVVTAGPRFAIRLTAHYTRRLIRGGGSSQAPKSILVIGAGDAGAMIVRETQHNPHLRMNVVGFLDDDRRKHHIYIHGVPVLGDRRAIPQVVQDYHVDQIIIAIPTAPGRIIREITGLCEAVGVNPKIIPGVYELLDGRVHVNQLRNVEIEDLLRREPVPTDTRAVDSLIRGQRVLVTGGGGSIGSELCRQILRCGPAELVVLGHGENSIFDICNELDRQLDMEARQVAKSSSARTIIRPVIADIRFPDRIHAIFQQYRPDLVFHAAAHKHVPLMESNPTEAISNNVLGTRNLLDAALLSGVKRFIMISTDKAVNPTSIMGASKRLAEILVHRAAVQAGKPYAAVRFGNVLGSRGSVVLTFKQQIAAGGPVTVTHPEMRRYFMTIPEAVHLVLQAAVLGQGGEVLMLDMGEPVKIVDLARDLIELSGLEVGRDIDIVFTGIRPGEKLFEELFKAGQNYRPTAHENVSVIDNANGHVPARVGQVLEALESAVQCNDSAAAVAALQSLIPEYTPCPETAAAQPNIDRAVAGTGASSALSELR